MVDKEKPQNVKVRQSKGANYPHLLYIIGATTGCPEDEQVHDGGDEAGHGEWGGAARLRLCQQGINIFKSDALFWSQQPGVQLKINTFFYNGKWINDHLENIYVFEQVSPMVSPSDTRSDLVNGGHKIRIEVVTQTQVNLRMTVNPCLTVCYMVLVVNI